MKRLSPEEYKEVLGFAERIGNPTNKMIMPLTEFNRLFKNQPKALLDAEEDNQRLRAENEELREALESISIESGCQAHGVKDPCDANIAKKALKSQGSKVSPTVTKFLLLLDTAVDKMEIVDASKVSMLVEALTQYASPNFWVVNEAGQHKIAPYTDMETSPCNTMRVAGKRAREALVEWEK